MKLNQVILCASASSQILRDVTKLFDTAHLVKDGPLLSCRLPYYWATSLPTDYTGPSERLLWLRQLPESALKPTEGTYIYSPNLASSTINLASMAQSVRRFFKSESDWLCS